ncbi:MAG: hypothetical protein JWN04_3739 [Myxococcaceae bacterium]|nr:hypothetical protein [Myxococcaceae bacterium]
MHAQCSSVEKYLSATLNEAICVGQPLAAHVERIVQAELSFVDSERLRIHTDQLLLRCRVCAVPEVRGQIVRG